MPNTNKQVEKVLAEGLIPTEYVRRDGDERVDTRGVEPIYIKGCLGVRFPNVGNGIPLDTARALVALKGL